MKRIVSASEMARMDRKTIDEIGVPGIVLMEIAGKSIADEIKKMLSSVHGKSVVIFCGKGNNGGDGYVIARYLYFAGANVTIFLAGKKEKIKGDALTNLNILENIGLQIKEISNLNQMDLPPQVDLVVDALLGTGVTGAVTGFYAELIQFINQIKAPVVAVDLPTGMDTNTGNILGDCVRADLTATMAHIKSGLLFSPARDYAGRISVVDIGIPPAVSEQLHDNVYLVESNDVCNYLPERKRNAHKTDCGKVVVIAGSVGMTGAATLASISTLQIGAGLTKLAIPESLNPILEQKLTEVMTVPMPETQQQSIDISAKDKIMELIEWADVLAVGPGLSVHKSTVDFVHWLLKFVNKPMVLDADGLNAIQNNIDLIKQYQNEIIVTPHPGELSRLVNIPTNEIVHNQIEILRQSVKQLNAIIVLKGGPTITGDINGVLYINSTGNPGMATGGSGDVLTGIIAGLWAQKLSAIQAAICGVYIHGLAGDLAAEQFTEMGMIAGDINIFLSEALKKIYST